MRLGVSTVYSFYPVRYIAGMETNLVQLEADDHGDEIERYKSCMRQTKQRMAFIKNSPLLEAMNKIEL